MGTSSPDAASGPSWTGAAAAAWQGPPPEVEDLLPTGYDGAADGGSDDERFGDDGAAWVGDDGEFPVMPHQHTDEKDFSNGVSAAFDEMMAGMTGAAADLPDVRITRLGDEDATEDDISQAALDRLTDEAELSEVRSAARQQHRALCMEQKQAKIKCDIPRRTAIKAAGKGSLRDPAAYERAAALYEAEEFVQAEPEYRLAIAEPGAAAPAAAGAVEEVAGEDEIVTEGFLSSATHNVVTNGFESQAEAAAPQRRCQVLAAQAAVAMEAAGKLTRVGAMGPPPPGASSPAPGAGMPSDRPDGGAGVSGGGGGAGYDHKRPAALEKYNECVRLYTEALQEASVGEEPSRIERARYFSARAEARIRLEYFGAAVADCDLALSFANGPAANTEKRRRRAASMTSKLQRRSDQAATEALELLAKESAEGEQGEFEGLVAICI